MTANHVPIIECEISAPTLASAIALYIQETDPDAINDDIYQPALRLSRMGTDLTLACPAYNAVGGKTKTRPNAIRWVCDHVVKPNPHGTLVRIHNLIQNRMFAYLARIYASHFQAYIHSV